MEAVVQGSIRGVGADKKSTNLHAGQRMPLSFFKAGEQGTVVKVRGTGDVRKHLENIGFVPGAQVAVVNTVAGNVVVEIMESQVGLDKQSAQLVVMS